MEATLTRPLPLQLTTPISLTPSIEEAVKAALDAGHTTYNPAAQVRENPEGIPQFMDGGGSSTHSNGQCNTLGLGNLIQVDADVVIDDNDVL